MLIEDGVSASGEHTVEPSMRTTEGYRADNEALLAEYMNENKRVPIRQRI